MSTLQVAGFLEHSNVNGEGFRSVLFLSGCYHACPGCHNQEMQAFDYGDTLDNSVILHKLIKNKPLIDGVTFSGGEPFEQCESLIELAKSVKEEGLSIWCYTGYTYDALRKDPQKEPLLHYIDVLIDGPYIEALKDEHLLYRGSSNQRILELKNGLIVKNRLS